MLLKIWGKTEITSMPWDEPLGMSHSRHSEKLLSVISAQQHALACCAVTHTHCQPSPLLPNTQHSCTAMHKCPASPPACCACQHTPLKHAVQSPTHTASHHRSYQTHNTAAQPCTSALLAHQHAVPANTHPSSMLCSHPHKLKLKLKLK